MMGEEPDSSGPRMASRFGDLVKGMLAELWQDEA